MPLSLLRTRHRALSPDARHPSNRRRTTRAQRAERRSRRSLLLERLENRRVLATLMVTSMDDEGPGTLRDAVETSNELAGRDTITFHEEIAGTISLLAANGSLQVTDSVAIQGPGAETLTIRAATSVEDEYRIMNVTGADVDVTIDGLTLTDGRILADAGGAIRFASQGNLTIQDSVITGNHASNGGAVYVEYNGSLDVSFSTISENTAHFGPGGAIHNNDGRVTMTSSQVSNNTSYASGGAIFSPYNGSISIADSVVSENRVTEAGYHGGAIYSGEGAVTISGSSISGNTSPSDGGGLYNYSGIVSIEGTQLHSNTAFYDGGAIFNDTGDLRINASDLVENTSRYGDGGAIGNIAGNVTLTKSNITGNRADLSGGGIANSSGRTVVRESLFTDNVAAGNGGAITTNIGAVTITNSTLSANHADRRGGGAHSDHAEFRLVNTTLAFNVAGISGGGIALTSDHEHQGSLIHNTIIAGNTAPQAPDLLAAAPITVAFSLIAKNDGSNLEAANPDAFGNRIGSTDSPIDAGLLSLDENGGRTKTHALSSGSLALANGDDSLAVDFGSDGAPGGGDDIPLVTDQRGANRFAGAVDIGAVERSPAPDVTWIPPEAMTYGTPLSPTQLNAFSSAGGTFAYTPDLGTVLSAGNNQILHTRFLPSDPLAFRPVDVSVSIDVLKADPLISWDPPDSIAFGTALSAAQLIAESDIAGTFAYSPTFGTILDPGTHLLTATFTPEDSDNYNIVQESVSVDVTPPLDFGDAPSHYPVRLADDGARHIMGSLRLGENVDAEPDGQPDSAANGDGEEDDGVIQVASPVAMSDADTTASFLVYASDAGRLDAWIDLDGDGDWSDALEQIASRLEIGAGETIVSYTIPSEIGVSGQTVARFRLSTVGGLSPTGPAADGEVEDYAFTILDGNNRAAPSINLPGAIAHLDNVDGSLIVRDDETVLFSAEAERLGQLQIFGAEPNDSIALNIESPPVGGLLIDGGEGLNTLLTDSLSLDLTDVSSTAVHNISVIDASQSGESVITIDGASVRRLSPGTLPVRIVTGVEDTIQFVAPAAWRLIDPIEVNGRFLQVASQLVSGEVVHVDSAAPWHNAIEPSDVNANGEITAGDALVIVNELGRRRYSESDTGQLNSPAAVDTWPGDYYDQNADGRVTSIDALRIINRLAQLSNAPAAEQIAPSLLQANIPQLPNLDQIDQSFAQSRFSPELDRRAAVKAGHLQWAALLDRTTEASLSQQEVDFPRSAAATTDSSPQAVHKILSQPSGWADQIDDWLGSKDDDDSV